LTEREHALTPGRATTPGGFDRAIARTAERYARAGTSRGTYYYVRGKLRGDPSTQAVAGLAPLGDVLDLGCGRGQLAVLLLECRAANTVRGCDWDDEKVAIANRAVEGLSGEFAKGDVRTAHSEPADTVLLIDVLHYFERAAQDALLTRAAGFVKPGGRLVLRDADTGRGWRSRMTRIEEGFFTAIKFNRGERVLFRDVPRELLPLLEAQGMSCSVVPCWGQTPFSNVLVVATRT
jgi:2-polyprenyl-3-methyl-5-hydroxy-6-metoxy-1,4-benzoquinol methylase